MTLRDHIDRAHRVAYRLAFPVLVRWWRLHGRHRGVSVAVWLDGKVLAARHSYKPGWRLISGSSWRNEDTRLTASRELREEVGVEVDPDALHFVLSVSGKIGTVCLYETRLRSMPNLTVDRREVIEARFVQPGMLIEQRYRNKIGAYVRQFST